MPRLYTKRQINDVLKELQIRTLENRVTSKEAAQILTWRAKREHNIDYEYTDATVRRHVALKNLKDIKRVSSRQSLYSVDELFELPLKPRHNQSNSDSTEVLT